MSVMFTIARKYPTMIEFVGSAMAGTGCIVMAICNHTTLIEMDDKLNNQELSLTLLYYVLYAGVLTTQFMWHIPTRVFWFTASYAICSKERVSNGQSSLGASITFFILGLILVEAIFYV